MSKYLKPMEIDESFSPLINLMELPEEIHIEMMKQCDEKSKLRLAETCSYFNQLLTNPKLTRNMKLKVVFDKSGSINHVIAQMNQVSSSGRSFDKWMLKGIFKPLDHIERLQLLECLMRFGSNVMELELVDVNHNLKDILQCFENIQKLELYCVHINETNLNAEVSLPQLKELKIGWTYSPLIRFFTKVTTLEQFTIHAKGSNSIGANTTLQSFLLQQHGLKLLELRSADYSELFDDDSINEIKFLLNTLIVVGKFPFNRFCAANFFRTQTQLKTLKLHDFYGNKISNEDPETFYYMIQALLSSPVLESFAFNDDIINEKKLQFLIDINNASVKHLQYLGASPLVLETVMGMFPNLHKVIVSDYFEKFGCISTEKLEIVDVENGFLRAFVCPKTCNRSVQNTFEKNIKNFLLRYRGVEYIEIGQLRWLNKGIALSLSFWSNLLPCLPNLRELTIYDSLQTRGIVELLTKAPQSFRSVKLYVNASATNRFEVVNMPWLQIIWL